MMMTSSRTVPQLFINRVREHPDQTAIVTGSQSISYAQLLNTVLTIAKKMQTLGFPARHPVVIYGNKSIEFISTIYACMYIGQPYIPLQETQPKERLKYLLEDSQVAACFYQTHADKQFNPEKLSVPCVSMSDLLLASTKSSDIDHTPHTDVYQHAFTLYTSGSTGTPKGVMFNQINLLTFIHWSQTTFSVNHMDRIASFAPLHFDLSTFDIFVSLSSGATIYCVPEAYKSFPSTLTAWLQQHQISIIYMVPTALISLIKKGNWAAQYAEHLRLILFAGEPFALTELCELRTLYPDIQIANLYGPTETNVCSWYAIPDLQETKKLEYLPIGMPINDLDLYIVDPSGQRLSEYGCIGELYCTGSSVALGYVHQGSTEQNSDNFFSLPPPSHGLSAGSSNLESALTPADKRRDGDSQRGYKTGDIVQLTSDGFVFLHRKDKQIKRNGYRIDPCEIESCLRLHPDVHDVAVIENNRKLIAFIEYSLTTNIETELRLLCHNYLHIIMHPDTFRFVEQLPKTSSGKIDYHTLDLSICHEERRSFTSFRMT